MNKSCKYTMMWPLNIEKSLRIFVPDLMERSGSREPIRVERTLVGTWPWSNVWLGVSVEDQATANERIPQLLSMPAARDERGGRIDRMKWYDLIWNPLAVGDDPGNQNSILLCRCAGRDRIAS